jgi:hypothetical protein
MNEHIREVSIDILKEDHQHEHKIEELKTVAQLKKESETFNSCCIRADKQMTQYIISTILIISVIIGSLVGLLLTEHTLLFSNLLSISVGTILPNPKMTTKNK